MSRPSGRAVLAGALALVAAALSVAAVWPAGLGLHGTLPFAQVVALRGATSVGLALVALVLVALPWRRLLLPAAAVLTVAALAGLAVLGTRGLDGATGSAPPPPEHPEDAVVVLVLNTQDGVAAADLADLVVRRRADVVVLPETLAADGEQVAVLAAEDGRDLQVLADDGNGRSATGATTVLVDRRLGVYEVVAEHPGQLSSFTAAPRDGQGPTVTATHPYPPVPGTMAGWRDEGRRAVGLCEDGSSDVVAGDLNATLDHPTFGELDRCLDATTAAGSGGVGTWPSSAPRLLGAPIDHVVVDGERWAVHSAAVVEPPRGTDHRAVEAVLVPAA